MIMGWGLDNLGDPSTIAILLDELNVFHLLKVAEDLPRNKKFRRYTGLTKKIKRLSVIDRASPTFPNPISFFLESYWNSPSQTSTTLWLRSLLASLVCLRRDINNHILSSIMTWNMTLLHMCNHVAGSPPRASPLGENRIWPCAVLSKPAILFVGKADM